ncbi:ATP-grasp domain-containing protein [Desulfuribacillus alkaliarsenatis]|uniref:D-alanine--D-alanine ligase n=1 Tax=Desulfuribacillus alkaliarsenatis TaxID=766136 RepID=A0A1E5G1A0_9FIRM|nr:ATP-grasp domain-containing protein [Desulfuribacillus alkaliarsenatis]OEF96675.1 D-alanine--D-alanine ligase [Desulfuribacillus alkaliarsenatis]
MKIAIIYNRDSQAVINLFGKQNREKYGLQTINRIKNALKAQGHQVQAFEGDKNIIRKLEEFMPSVISGERPGLVFNLSYGIQGRARYTHIPSILEMLGIPYVGSGPESHGIALDKVVTKMILIQKGLPTPKFAVLEKPDDPLDEALSYPMIVKPRDEAVSFGLKVVRNEQELREGVKFIYDTFNGPTLVEEFIEGMEVNVGLLGNQPVEALPPVELQFGEGEQIYTYEDKTKQSGRTVQHVCPANLSPEQSEQVQKLAIDAFKAIGLFDSARVDFRIDKEGNPYILEINSLASLGLGGSYVYAANYVGLDYDKLVNRLVDVASQRYFGTPLASQLQTRTRDKRQAVFTYLTKNRDKIEEELKLWTNISSRTEDAVGLSTIVRKLDERLQKIGLHLSDELSNRRSVWTWETEEQKKEGTLLVFPIDIPIERRVYPVPFRKDPEWLHGEGIASSRAGIITVLYALSALKIIKKLKGKKIGVLAYSDEGRGMRYSNTYLQMAASNYEQVLVMNPGIYQGKVVDQRRGSRKYKVVIDGSSMRVGSKVKKDVMSWFMERYDQISQLNRPEDKLSVAVLDIHSDRYSILLSHRLQANIYVNYLNSKHADLVEKRLKEIFVVQDKEIHSNLEKLEERAPLIRNRSTKKLIEQLKSISEEWQLPFGVDSSLLPSAAGVVPTKTPVLCGLAPASKDIYTPDEAIHRGELLQRLLLLTLYLLKD